MIKENNMCICCLVNISITELLDIRLIFILAPLRSATHNEKAEDS
jgi:hypothetical protein